MPPQTIATKQNVNSEYSLKFFSGDSKYVIYKQGIGEMRHEAAIAEEIEVFDSEEKARELFDKL